MAGICYGIRSTSIGYGWGTQIFGCMMCGFLIGVAGGDPAGGLIVGALVQSIYMGLIAPGGNTPADAALACCVAAGITVASQGAIDYDTAVTLAVPVGLLGALVTILRYIINGFFVDPAEAYADKADAAGIWRCAFLYPFIIRFALGFTIVFLAVYAGTDVVAGFLSAIPEWLQHGLSVAGGMLPIMGFALTIYIIGQPKFIPLFIIGFFMVQYGGLSVMAISIFAVCIMLFLAFLDVDRDNKYAELYGEEDFDDFEDEEKADLSEQKILTQNDVNYFVARWLCFCEVPHSYQRMQALALCSAMAPALEKMYPGEENKEKLASALHREMMYFNTQGIWGSSVLGVALAMEEEQAITQAMTEEQATASINGLKVGFMGPFAGVGDTIDWATFQYLLIGLGLPFALEGNPMGILFQSVGFPVLATCEALFFTNMGYNLGRTAIGSMFTSGLIDRLIDTSCMIGMMMMGALTNSYVHISLASEEAQATLDKIIPGILPLVFTFGLYLIMLYKTQNMPMITAGILLISVIGALIGLL